MKALAFNEFGGPDKLKLQDVPDPKIEPNEVLVKVRACALNHLDLFVREGIPALKTPLPFWTGCDIAGEVAEVGAQAQGVKVGDRVAVNPNLTCGRCEVCSAGGTASSASTSPAAWPSMWSCAPTTCCPCPRRSRLRRQRPSSSPT